jgi:hypothetical protein
VSFASLASLGGNIFSAFLGYKGTQDTNETNLDIARSNNAWSAEQYAKRYQTQTSDIMKAGLNPMLAYSQSPGTAPSAQQVSFQNPMSSAIDAYHKSNERDVMAAQIQNTHADTDLKSAQAEAARAQASLAADQARNVTAQANKATVEMVSQQNYGNPTQKALAASYWSQIAVNKATLPRIASEIVRNGADAGLANARARQAIAEGDITIQDLERAKNDARYERATGGVIRQTSRDLGNITGAAANARRAGMTKR